MKNMRGTAIFSLMFLMSLLSNFSSSRANK
jgi:hypothetical protein